MTRPYERREFAVRRPTDGVVIVMDDETMAIEWHDRHGGTILSHVITVGPWEEW